MTNCPVCDSRRIRTITKLRGSRTGNYTPLHICLECYTLYQRPGYHEDDKTLRGDLNWHVSQKDIQAKSSEKIIRRLLSINPQARTLLDIGCGIGRTLLVAQRLGLCCRGVEPNPYAVDYARSNYGLNVTHAYFKADLFSEGFEPMSRASVLTHGIVWLAVWGLCLPPIVVTAAAPDDLAPGTKDVALEQGGMLVGQVVDSEGSGVANSPVTLQFDNQPIATSMTDGNGVFAFQQVRGGVHQVAAREMRGTYRLWEPGTAPPSAQPSARLITGTAPLRGTWARTRMFLSNPWVIGALVATAIAVPVAISLSDDKSPGSP